MTNIAHPATDFSTFRSDPEVDAGYNASAAVADAATYAPRWTEQSRRVRETLRSVLDVPYGPTPAETLDIFPAAKASAPVFVFLHGGYWRAFTSKEFSWVAEGLHAAGITTVVVNYALCPAVTIDEIVRQCRSAVAWTIGHIARHGGDPSRVSVGGHSAGGHLTAMCANADWAAEHGLPPHPIKSAMLVSGVYELAPLMRSYLQPQIRLDAGIVERNSPVFAVRRSTTPALVTWGQDESSEFARQSTRMYDAWRAAGNPGELLPLAGLNHFSAIDGFSSPDSALVRWLLQNG